MRPISGAAYLLLSPVRFAVNAVATIVEVAVIARRYGPAVLGDWSLIGLAASLGAVAEVGFGRACQLAIIDEVDGGRRRLAVTRSAYLVYSIACAALIWGGFVFLGTSASNESMPLAWSLAAVGVWLSLLARIRWVELLALGFRAQALFLELLFILLLNPPTLLGAVTGHPIMGFAAGVLAAGAGSLCFGTYLCRGRVPRPVAVRWKTSLAEWRVAYRFVRGFSAVGILDSAREPLVRLAFVMTGGAPALAIYAVASRPALFLRQLLGSGFPVIFSESAGAHDQAAAEEGVSRTTRLVAVVSLAAGIAVASVLPELLVAWVGEELKKSAAVPAQLLLIVACAQLVVGPCFFFGQARRSTRSAALALLLELGLVVGILLAVGPFGAALSVVDVTLLTLIASLLGLAVLTVLSPLSRPGRTLVAVTCVLVTVVLTSAIVGLSYFRGVSLAWRAAVSCAFCIGGALVVRKRLRAEPDGGRQT